MVNARWIRLAALVSATSACGGAPAPEASPLPPPPAAAPSSPEPATSAPAPSSAPAAAEPATSLIELELRKVRDYVHAFNRHDAKAIAALYAEDAVFIERGEFVSAGSGSIESSYKEYFDAFPDASTSITRSWHRGDTVVIEYVEGGTHTGPHRVHKPTGKKVGYAGASLLKFTPNGLVKTDTTYSDELTKEVQAGWAPGPLAKMKVRPLLAVPPATDSWEVHTVAEQDATQGKADAARRSLYTKLSSRSERDFLAALSDDVVLMPYDDPSDATGKQGASALFRDWTRTFAESGVDLTEGWAVDGYFVALGTFTGKHTGDWGPIKPTKKTCTSHFLDIAKVGKDDKIERLWSYANNYELLRHLGYQKREVVAGAPR